MFHFFVLRPPPFLSVIESVKLNLFFLLLFFIIVIIIAVINIIIFIIVLLIYATHSSTELLENILEVKL